MTAAIFGLIGVLVGGLLQGVIAWRMERRREGWAARKAGRLFAQQLIGCVTFIEEIGDHVSALTWDDVTSTLESNLRRWPEYSEVFAGTLDYKRWHQIAYAVRALEGVIALAHDRAASDDPMTSAHRQYIDESSYRDVLLGASVCHGVGWVGVQRQPIRRAFSRMWHRLRPPSEDDLMREAFGDEAYGRLFGRDEPHL